MLDTFENRCILAAVIFFFLLLLFSAGFPITPTQMPVLADGSDPMPLCRPTGGKHCPMVTGEAK